MSTEFRTPSDDGEFTRRIHAVIPGGAHTYSRGDDQLPELAPRCFVRAKGGRAWDLNGREFVDWGMGINNVLIGHAENAIDEAAFESAQRGQALTRPSIGELQLAETLIAVFPGMEMAKFAKNGSDANLAAIRLARAITGKKLIAFDAAAPFLGIHDWFIGSTVMNAGVPEAVQRLSVPFRFNDFESMRGMFELHGADLAIVVLEVCRDIKPASGFLEELRTLCDRFGTLLLFDEIVTAFRYSLRGMYAEYGVIPDFLSLGKGMANGYALSALLGKRECMMRAGLHHTAERVFILSTTNGPEQSALGAALATIDFYGGHDVIGQIRHTGGRLTDIVDAAAREAGIEGHVTARTDYACRPLLVVRDARREVSASYKTLMQQELARHGVFLPWVCPCFRHTQQDLDRTEEAMVSATRVVANALSDGSVEKHLVGSPSKPVFRRYN